MRSVTLVVLIAAGLVTGCVPTPEWSGRPAAAVPRVSTRTTEVVIDSASGPRPWERERLRAAVAAARPDGLRVEIVTATDVDPEPIARAVREMGVAARRVQLRRSNDLPPATAAVFVNDTRIEAPTCADTPLPPSIGRIAFDMPTPVLGCATAAGFAAMVADPNDLNGGTPGAPFNTATAVKAIDDMRAAGDTHKKTDGGTSSTSSHGTGTNASGSESK